MTNIALVVMSLILVSALIVLSKSFREIRRTREILDASSLSNSTKYNIKTKLNIITNQIGLTVVGSTGGFRGILYFAHRFHLNSILSLIVSVSISIIFIVVMAYRLKGSLTDVKRQMNVSPIPA